MNECFQKTFFSFMFWFLVLFLFLCVSNLVNCDDTQALRNAVKCLCQVNTAGKFASCCASYSNGDSISLSGNDCFFSSLVLDSSKQYVNIMFVICFFYSIFITIHNNRMNNKEITSIPSGCFSSLSSLSTLFKSLFISVCLS